ncbi:protein mono-ADP-ribosyltransferase PARP4 isoform X3 [Fundulus heteroclitus]|uniref:protein mono-ADP-ribosyltransferase PARP4 isoform X3 n=1 Tax=Fundulus heteroclitus TaxID=8078 RepID=UPI00165BC9A0|nr:protein mono-ADP-ribosyltransferase PARP4 isoform X3 [Fundulus heteroclitus]
MGVFDNCSVLLELKNVPLKEKNKLKSAVTKNGGSICFIVNKKCSLVVTNELSNLSSNRQRSIQKHQTPVVGLDYVYNCVERGVRLSVDGYKMNTSSTSSSSAPPQVTSSKSAPVIHKVELPKGPGSSVQTAVERNAQKFRIYHERDSDLPPFPDDFQVAKYSIFGQNKGNKWCVLELQSARAEQGRRYRVVRYWQEDVTAKKASVMDRLVFLSTSEEALDVFKEQNKELERSYLQRMSSVPAEASHLGSAPLQQLLLEEKLNSATLSQEVAVFVEMLWTEALGRLGSILLVPISKLSLNDVSRAEGLLLQAQKELKEGNQPEAASLLKEVFDLLPHREPRPPFPTAKFLSQKLDLCQLIRDVLNVSEMTLSSPELSSVGKYRALRCSIDAVSPSSAVFQNIAALLADRPVQIQQIVRVSRAVELQTFQSDLGNIKPLLHSSSPSNFVGILSRGLLLPRVGVEHHGIERTDVGHLGSGIYFSDAVSTSLKYSKPSDTDGSRLLLVCDVALGSCRDVHSRDTSLTKAPEGFHSVHGVRRSNKKTSEFQDDEYVVYSPDQVKITHVVQFRVEGDQLKDFSPDISLTAEPAQPAMDIEMSSDYDEEDLEEVRNPLQDVTAGLLDSSGQQLPLQAVHVKCKLMDLLSQVIIFQKYTNQSSVPIEAKYVFPLDDSAAVCGFEAFINGKHVVGQVKEKETARREYRRAIEKGHGAYLMDQDAPDVFTISVGNLPPGATVLIKVTFVSELVVRDGSIVFSLPGSVAPWQESSALNQTTQVSVQKVCVADEAAREFSLDMSVEMPYEILSLNCITHQVKMKRTDTKAVVSVLPGQVMGPDGFQLSVTLSEVHLPRMWVEKHPDKDSQACMLVFYPDFEFDSGSGAREVVLLLDSSESMRGEPFHLAQKVALQVLRNLKNNVRINLILFGTDHTEAFLTAKRLGEVQAEAKKFIKSCSSIGGSTELWRPLRALSLLPPSSGVRNLLLLSDGHVQNAAATLQLLRDNAQHSRLFTCGLSSTANRHMLRALAQAGGGAYEFFDTKAKHTWAEKVARQVKRMSSPGCSSVSVKWQQFNQRAAPPLQAPKQLHALFNDCHTLVYGFVAHCTQATLLGDLRGQELKTMVSTTELQKTRGTFLHKLTARALIRDYEDGSLDTTEAEHEGKKAELKSFIISLSKEFSILSQFTSFVAIEERDSEGAEEGVTDIPKLIAEEDVDILPYVSWTSPQDEKAFDPFAFTGSGSGSEKSEESDDDMGFGAFDDVIESSAGATIAKPTSVTTLRSPATRFQEQPQFSSYMYSRESETWGSLPKPPSLPPPQPSESGVEMSASIRSECADMSSSDARMAPATFERLALGKLMAPTTFGAAQRGPQGSPPVAVAATAASFRPKPSALRSAQSASFVFGSPPVAPPRFSVAQTAGLFGRVESPIMGSALHFGSALPPVCSTRPPSARYEDSIAALVSARAEPIPRVMGRRDSGSADDVPSTLCSDICMDEPMDSRPKSLARNAKHFICAAPAPESSSPERSSDPLPPPPPPVKHAQEISNFPEPASQIEKMKRLSRLLASRHLQRPDGSPLKMSSSLPSTRPAEPMGILPAERFSARSFWEEAAPPPPPPPPPVKQAQEISNFPETANLTLSQIQQGKPLSKLKASKRLPRIQSTRRAEPSRIRPAERFSARSFREKVFPIVSTVSLRILKKASVMDPCPDTEGVQLHRRSRDPDPEELRQKWSRIFLLQHADGFWELTVELGELINLNVDAFANVFLKNRGIHSLGAKAHADILKLVATLLVLQLMRVEKLEEGKLLQSLFRLTEPSQSRSERWQRVKKAVDWVCWADRQYPCICSRLEFGWSWESSTRQLLGFERLPPSSPLVSLDLQKTAAPLLVH